MTVQLPEPSHPTTGGQPQAGGPRFDQVTRGYDARQVDDYLRRLLDHLHALEQRLAHAGADLVHDAESSPAARKAVSDLMQLALDEITGQRQAAEAEIAQLIQDATAQAVQVRSAAQQEAAQISAGAREQAAVVVSEARATAQAQLNEASAHAAAVTEGAQRRLQVLTSLHEDTVQRLSKISQVSRELVTSESQRGSLADEVARVAGSPL